MKEKIDRTKKFLKKNIRLSVMMITFLFGILIFTISYSYAFFTISLEKQNSIQLVAGELQYDVSLSTKHYGITFLDDETVHLHKDTWLTVINVEIESLNTIDSNIMVYYEGTIPENCSVYYDTETPAVETIGTSGDKKIIKVVIFNPSRIDVYFQLKVVGSLSKESFSLPEQASPITNKIRLLYDYLGTQYEEYTGGWGRYLTTANIENYYGAGFFPLEFVENSAGNTLMYWHVTSSTNQKVKSVRSLATNHQIDLSDYTKLVFISTAGNNLNNVDVGCYKEFVNIDDNPSVVNTTPIYNTSVSVVTTMDVSKYNTSCYPGIVLWSSDYLPETNTFLGVYAVWLE